MAAPLSIRDARGKELSLDSPRRVVSLVPSLTESLVEFELGDRLVGRTRYCIHPAEALRNVPTYGGTKDPDIEGIIAASPDLVLACIEENRPPDIERLEAAGLDVLALFPRSLEDVAALYSDLELLFGASPIVLESRQALAAARERAATFRTALTADRAGGGPRALTLIWKRPWMAAGSETYIHAIMEELGLVNAGAGRRAYFEVSEAEMAAMNLDLILLPDEPYRFGAKDAAALTAAGLGPGPEGHILLDGEDLCWYGSRSPRALEALLDQFQALRSLIS